MKNTRLDGCSGKRSNQQVRAGFDDAEARQAVLKHRLFCTCREKLSGKIGARFDGSSLEASWANKELRAFSADETIHLVEN